MNLLRRKRAKKLRRLIEQLRFFLWFIICATAAIGFFYAQNRASAVAGFFQGTFADASGFVEQGILNVCAQVGDSFYRISSLMSERHEVLQLRAELEQKHILEAAVRELGAENDRLRSLSNMAAKLGGGKPLGARVVGRTGAPLTRMMRIDRGSADGISRGDSIVSASGAVGQIFALGRHFSDVLLLSDSESTIDVLVARSRARGLLRGSARGHTYAMRVSDFDRLEDVQEGDVLVTSGLGARFPAGVPVGTIGVLRNSGSGMHIEASVIPSTDFGKLEFVLVLPSDGRQDVWSLNEIVLDAEGQSLHSPIEGQP
jgi:rod shape-determining protein MreC